MSDLFTLSSDNRRTQAELLQPCLADLIDLALVLKQAHWNLVGPNFLSIHERFDAILADVREGSDAVAERLVTLGHPADGRVATVGSQSRLPGFPAGIISVEQAVDHAAAALAATIHGMRSTITTLGDLDPITEDLFIATAATLEKHHWMLRAHRETPAERAGLS